MLRTAVQSVRSRARAKRARVFLSHFEVRPDTKILDIGSENGAHIASVLAGTPYTPEQVHIADINERAVAEGHRRFGFTPVKIDESGRLPFDDGFFDIVYCSSVIEHVTVPKGEIWSLRDGTAFRRRAWKRQRRFAREIGRIGKGYFVQTPCRTFPIETHSWLPFLGYLRRRALVSVLAVTNRFWIKKTAPDWNLLSEDEMRRLFPDATLVNEQLGGLTKSIMAIGKDGRHRGY